MFHRNRNSVGADYKEVAEERDSAGGIISRREAENCRHRLEKRWYRRLVFINFFLIIAVCAAVIVHAKEYPGLAKQAWKQLQDEVQDEIQDEMGEELPVKIQGKMGEGIPAKVQGKVGEELLLRAQYDSREERGGSAKKDADSRKKLTEEDIPIELQLLVYGIFVLVVVYLALYYFYAKLRSSSLRITEHNFPEVYALIQEYAHRLHMKQVPKAYVMQANGVLNAFSSFLFRRQYIEINAEIFEIAYREYHDMDALGFVIAHEMAHIYYGHATLHYHLLILFSNSIPVIGAIASRAREYSADRLAQRVSGSDGVEAMFMLIIDRHLYKMVDREDYLQEAAQQKGLFLWIVNMLADHPVLCKRIRALDQGEGSGELY